MFKPRIFLPVVLLVGLIGGRPSAQGATATSLLDRYLAGEYGEVVSALAVRTDFGSLLDDLRAHAPAWITAGGSDARERRALVAATVALEAARADARREWRWSQILDPSGCKTIYWQGPPKLLDWGHSLFPVDAPPTTAERRWHHAALAVVQRAEDFEYLIGNDIEPPCNVQDQRRFLDDVRKRFPGEPRFELAYIAALESAVWRYPSADRDAVPAFESLLEHDDIGGEVSLRFGTLLARARVPDDIRAITLFERAENRTRDRFVVYLARYFKGQALERQRRPADAERAYRGALAAVPNAQAASIALARLLASSGRRTDASAIVESMLAADPKPIDPWRIYMDGDDRFWPELIARVREEIGPEVLHGSSPSVLQSSSPPVLPGSSPPALQGSQFRSSTDAVFVDVSVRDGGLQVAGLAADDFVLTDNGVRQKVESVETTRLPIDVTLIADVGGNPRLAWYRPKPISEWREKLTDQMRRTAAILRPGDRLRVLTVDDHIDVSVPMSPASALPSLRLETSDGYPALHDALAAALLRVVEPDRRHVVLVMTRGLDVMSTLDAAAVRDLAKHSDAVLHVVWQEQQKHQEDLLEGFQSRFMNLTGPSTRFWVPSRRSEIKLLTAAAEATGGVFWTPTVTTFGDRDLQGTFKQVFEDFRQGYVLRYMPQGVERTGWHEIAVSVPTATKAVVTARRGYGIDSAKPPVPVPPTPVDSIAAAFERGDDAAVAKSLRETRDLTKLLRDFRAAGNPWPMTPQREAVFVLELAHAALFSRVPDAVTEAHELLVDYDRLIRPSLGPDRFECLWRWADLALVEGTIQSGSAMRHATRALARCPGEARFLLAHAVVTDQRWPLGTAAFAMPSLGPTAALPGTAHINEVISRYEAAIPFAETAAEARIRLGWFLCRIGRCGEALTHLDRVDAALGDRELRYLRDLVRGQALRAEGRVDEAAAAYRAALVTWPGAQSAQVSLMTLLASRGDREQAVALAELIQTSSDSSTDPWWRYWQADYRVFPAIMARLRELVR